MIVCLFLIGLKSRNTDKWKEVRRAAAETIAGQGMLRLAAQSVKSPQAALTFDDGPDAQYTPLLLDGLKARNIKATFFLIGEKVEENREIVNRMQEEGHLIGNHTYHHVQLDKLNTTTAKEEILKTNNIIYETTGVYPQFMRPPYGSWKKDLELCVEMLPVFWTIDTLDWKVQDVETILSTVQNEVEDGSIILMHDEYAATVEAALAVADDLQEQGYELVTVDKLTAP